MIGALAAVTIAVSTVVAPAMPWWATAQNATHVTTAGGVTWTEVHCKHPEFRQPVCWTVTRSKHPGIRPDGIQPVKTSA